MAILDKSILISHGPHVELASLPALIPIEEGSWPERESYESHIFFCCSDWLLDTMNGVTHSSDFLFRYDFVQYGQHPEIFDFTSKVMLLASRIAECPINYFTSEISIYKGSLVPEEQRTAGHLQTDLVETLLFIASKCIQISKDGRCLAIVGI